MARFAWVTLATNDSYSLGALVLGHSLRRVNTAHQLVVLITPSVTEAMKTQLSAVYNVVKVVDVLDSKDADNLALLARPELGITFTKLHCWQLTDYDKCVFLDADTLVLQNSDELFDREELSAAPDAGWPDCFNSGVFVYKPSNDTFKALIEFALIHGSFDGGDQGLLNLFFKDWPTKDIKKHLPFVYNMCSTATYSYLPAFKQFGQGLKIIHFIGTAKPWLQPFNTETSLVQVSGESHHVREFVQFWWDLFCTLVHSSLSSEMIRHRLSTSYDFTPSRPFLAPTTFVQSHFDAPPSSSYAFSESTDNQEETCSYFDPWDEVAEENYSQQLFQDSFHNDLDHFSSNRQIESNQPDGQLLSKFEDCSLPKDNNDEDEQFPSSDIWRRGSDSNFSFGGGMNEISSRPLRRDSFPQPERSISAPEMTLGLEEVACVEVETPTEPPDSSVENHLDQHSSDDVDAGLAGALASVTLGSPLSTEQFALEEHLRRQGWEQGNIDYMGKDSFANIWKKICDTLSGSSVPIPSPEAPTPAPVAPIAAPVFVSSVEMSPAGPIDTSPPASYAPVSALTPTVVASDTEAASKAAPAETSTVAPQPQSPSVTEVASAEVTSSATAISSQVIIEKAAANSQLVVSSTTEPATQLAPEPVAKIDVSIAPVSQPEPTAETAPDQTVIALKECPKETKTPPTTPVTDSAPIIGGSLPEALVAAIPLVDPPAKADVVPDAAQCPTVIQTPPSGKEDVTPVESIAPEVASIVTPTKTEVVLPAVGDKPLKVPTKVDDIALSLATKVETAPEAAKLDDVPANIEQTPTSVATDVLPSPVAIPTGLSTPEIQTAQVVQPALVQSVPGPITISEVPVGSVAIPEPVILPPTAEIPASATTVIPTLATSQASPVETNPIPVIEPTSAISPPVAETPPPATPAVPTEEKPAPVQPESPAITEPTPPASPSTTETPVSAPAETKPAQIQPGTPTVTEPTPPTSPPAVPVEPLLAAKLQVDTEVPTTPPVEGATQPAAATGSSEEPPIPPKRKGGSKASQEAKTQKGGKPTKGKK